MARSSKLLNQEVAQTARDALKGIGKDALIARKLEAILAASKHSLALVAKIYDISRTTLTAWIKHLKAGNLNKLRAPEERKRKSIMNYSDRELIKTWIDKDPQVTIQWLVQNMLEERGKKISKSTMLREVQKLKYSYITPRKQHVKQDKDRVIELKKYGKSDH